MNGLELKMEETQKRKRELASRLQKLKKEFCATSGGEDFQMLEPLLANATLASILVTLPKGASSLLLGLVIATAGIKTSESPGGIVGPHLVKMIEAIASGLQSSELWQPKADLAATLMIEKLSLSVVLGALILGHWMGTNKGNALVEANAEVTRIISDLLLLMLASTPYVKIALVEMIKTTGANERTQDLSSEVLALVFVCLSALAATKTMKQKPEELFESLHTFLKRSFTQLTNFLGETKWETNYLPVVVQQAKMALENENFMAFYDASNDLFEGIGISNEGFDADCERIFTFADALFASFTKGNDTMGPPGTAISVVA